MRRATPKAAVVAAFLAVSTLAIAHGPYGTIDHAQVTRVYDGDTVFVDIPGWHPVVGADLGIRLRGIDAPEIRGRCDYERDLAARSRDRLAELIGSDTSVSLVDVERGRYFRIVATLVADGRDVAEILIREGLAVAYDGDGPRGGWCD